jgi:hypothetical protein
VSEALLGILITLLLIAGGLTVNYFLMKWAVRNGTIEANYYERAREARQ